jgi:acetolactate synthase-1/2/3 large subunit
MPYVFGLPGDPGHLYDALYEAEPDGGPRAIGVRYETSGAFLAMAYARVSGQLAACFGCPGPGIANLVPGILEAFSGCTPMLVLGVRASRLTNGMGAFQECDHIGMLRPITKWATTVETAERIPWTIRRAVQLARSGQPGPVYVELPADIGKDKAEIPPYVRSLPPSRPAPDPAAIAEAANLLAAAERPLLVTGGGAILSVRATRSRPSPIASGCRSRRRRPGAAAWRRRTRSSPGWSVSTGRPSPARPTRGPTSC